MADGETPQEKFTPEEETLFRRAWKDSELGPKFQNMDRETALKYLARTNSRLGDVGYEYMQQAELVSGEIDQLTAAIQRVMGEKQEK